MESKPDGKVPLLSGDEALKGRKVDFIKMDVEGLEISVLNGLDETIKKHSPTMLIEVDDARRTQFDAWCMKAGYEIIAAHRRYRWNENFLVAKL